MREPDLSFSNWDWWEEPNIGFFVELYFGDRKALVGVYTNHEAAEAEYLRIGSRRRPKGATGVSIRAFPLDEPIVSRKMQTVAWRNFRND